MRTNKITELLIKYYFRMELELTVPLGSKVQIGSITANISTIELWKRETILTRILSIIKFKWIPTEITVTSLAKEMLMGHIFGTPSNYSDELFNLMVWHNSQDWNFDNTNEKDGERAFALESLAFLTYGKYQVTSDVLKLNLADKYPEICLLINAMIKKIPIISIQYCLNIHSSFVFNSIRKSGHKYADDIISYLYEIITMQQKIAFEFHDLLVSIDYTDRNKGAAIIINGEVNSIKSADSIITYLKASIEKTIVLLGFIFNITKMDEKKTHKEKLKALQNSSLIDYLDVYYVNFVMEFIKSENLEKLNKLRTGTLHKKGISNLQPHSYIGENTDTMPLKNIFYILHEQHANNTAVLIGVLAILTMVLEQLATP